MDFKKKMGERGSISLSLVYIFLAVVVLFIFAFAIPLLININTEFYAAAEDLIDDTNQIVQNDITNPAIKLQLEEMLSSNRESIPTQIAILSNFFNWGWFVVMAVVLLVLFLVTRQVVEFRGGNIP